MTLTVSLTLTFMLLLINACLFLKPYLFGTYSNILVNLKFPYTKVISVSKRDPS